jgi:hypothetical protein
VLAVFNKFFAGNKFNPTMAHPAFYTARKKRRFRADFSVILIFEDLL